MNRGAGFLTDIRASGRPAVGVGVHNAITASLVELAGFDLLWLSSLEVSTAKLLPDVNLITFSEVSDILREIKRAASIPIIVDADNGYGSDETAMRAAQEFRDSGATAICIEDNAFPKRGSFYTGVERPLEDINTFCRRIEKVRRTVGNQLDIIARTEGLVAGLGARETIERAYAYREAGADALFVQTDAATTEDFMRVLSETKTFAPIVITPTALPELSVTQLHALGANVVIFSNVVMRTIINAVRETLYKLKIEQSLSRVNNEIASFDEIFELTHAHDWLAGRSRV
jgi:phosphoenolpyruvate phosphomutase